MTSLLILCGSFNITRADQIGATFPAFIEGARSDFVWILITLRSRFISRDSPFSFVCSRMDERGTDGVWHLVACPLSDVLGPVKSSIWYWAGRDQRLTHRIAFPILRPDGDCSQIRKILSLKLAQTAVSRTIRPCHTLL
jgi:hypothetical protein